MMILLYKKPEEPPAPEAAPKSANDVREKLKKQGYKLDKHAGNYYNAQSDVFREAEILDEALVTVLQPDGKTPLQDLFYWNERNHEVVPTRLKLQAAKALSKANAAMIAAGKGPIKIWYSTRTNEQQDYEYQRKERGEIDVAAPPGHSFHEVGQAIDVHNWKEATPYLLAAGFVGGFGGLDNDYGHFEYGSGRERAKLLTRLRQRAVEKIREKVGDKAADKADELAKKAGEKVKKGVEKAKEWWKNRKKKKK